MIRALTLVVLLASLGWWLDREHQAGRFQRVDELFLDFLVANARDRFVTSSDQKLADSPVVLVKMRVADKAEYVGWPPRPLDWQMILKSLQAYEPAVVVVPETLFWGSPSPEFVNQAAQALLPIPSVVLGVEGELASSRDKPAFLGGLEDSLPVFQKVQGGTGSVPALGALVAAPDTLMRQQAELGITVTHETKKDHVTLPYAVQEGGRLRTTVLAQALARFTRTPYATHRLTLETGSGAYLAGGVFVNLTREGEWVCMDRHVPEVDALNLMTSDLAEALSAKDKAALTGGKLIVIGTDDDKTGGLARLHAVALAEILAMPRLRILPDWGQWIVWGLAGLLGVRLTFVPRSKALPLGAMCIFAALVVCFLAFQSSLIWCPPTIPAALLAVSTLFARITGRVK